MDDNTKPVANPNIVLREEFDDWALLFDPDTGDTFTLDPVSVFIWKRLDGTHTLADLHREITENCDEVPGEAPAQIRTFVETLLERGLAGIELKTE
ncbi:MAG: SynChlorMet cassette protein ScmD [Candidatus Omnitrophica bacterium]|nr:SynChlorMet cassette protein ScmD [Candidatus Omnitrophota bacterium]